jgi:hypothetical protein
MEETEPLEGERSRQYPILSSMDSIPLNFVAFLGLSVSGCGEKIGLEVIEKIQGLMRCEGCLPRVDELIGYSIYT